MTIAVQVGGKLRGTIEVPVAAEDDVLRAAAAEDNVARLLAGKTMVKRIYVPGRIVNFAVSTRRDRGERRAGPSGLLLGLAGRCPGAASGRVYAVRERTSPAQHELGLIDVALLPDRAGQLLRQALAAAVGEPGEALAKRYESRR